MIDKNNIDPFDDETVDLFDHPDWKPVDNFEEMKAEMEQAARNTLAKNKDIVK